ncbi:MAG: hypothetical protein K2X81_08745 [Candidatus Obscuribacterales bacterium]|nr:hypothetical protein [Candidatus Obscuribacterales bacterium]
MRSVYLDELITLVEGELEDHKLHLLDDPLHTGCHARLNSTLEFLQKQKEKPDSTLKVQAIGNKPDDAAVRGEELESTELLQRFADELENRHKVVDANRVRQRARELLKNELNELDGFAR